MACLKGKKMSKSKDKDKEKRKGVLPRPPNRMTRCPHFFFFFMTLRRRVE